MRLVCAIATDISLGLPLTFPQLRRFRGHLARPYGCGALSCPCSPQEWPQTRTFGAHRPIAVYVTFNLTIFLIQVYGGGTVGLMGEVARTLVSLSGPSSVHGIIPRAIVSMEQQASRSDQPRLSFPFDENVYGRTTVVEDMHTRKQMMAQEVINGGRGGGFVALSGGYGTFEELMEVTTWNQLGIHNMPVVVYNVDGYWTELMKWVKNAVAIGFVSKGNAEIVVEAHNAESVIQCLLDYKIAPGRFSLQWEKDVDASLGIRKRTLAKL
jgi:uncharacterized protein (TIGR00730 family)